jgi:hypothetical protein
VLAADIRITPVDANSRNPGLRISDSWSLFGTDSIFSVFSFNVQVKPSGAKIKDASLIALTTQTLLGNAITQATEGVCTTGFLPCGGTLQTMSVTLNKNSRALTDIASSPARIN